MILVKGVHAIKHTFLQKLKQTIAEIERRFTERGVGFGERGNVDGALARKILERAL